jgi:hypothetical protein
MAPRLRLGGGLRGGAKMPRHKLHLPTTTGTSKPAFQMSAQAWTSVEKKYGNKLPDQIRIRIEDATLKYLWLAQMERGALPLTSARDIISAVHQAAQALLEQLKAIHDCDDDARSLVGHLLRPRIKLPNRKPLGDHLKGLVRDLEILNLALFDTKAAVQTAGYQQKGQAWSAWVRNLRDILKEAGLPCGISKDRDTDDSASTASPFVRLVYQIQEDYPQERWRFKGARSLATAMYRAIHAPSARASGTFSAKKPLR